MSQPRRIEPGKTYMISRRTTQRKYLLRPDSMIGEIFLYCLAYAAMLFGVVIHGWVVMPNHFHLVVTDVWGKLPEFMGRLDRLVATAVNCFRGRWENLFAPGSYDAVEVVDEADLVEKLTYVLVNPVAAGLVSHSKDWEGATSRRWSFGETRVVSRPKVYFSAKGSMPAEIPLTLTPLPGPGAVGRGEQDDVVRASVMARETEIRAEFREQGRTFKGMAEVMRISVEDSPSTVAPRRGLNPRFACRDRDLRIEVLRAYAEWLSSYRVAYLAYRGGETDVVFPQGTYLMRVRHHVRVGEISAGAYPPTPPPS